MLKKIYSIATTGWDKRNKANPKTTEAPSLFPIYICDLGVGKNYAEGPEDNYPNRISRSATQRSAGPEPQIHHGPTIGCHETAYRLFSAKELYV
ncbi:hypothetical protein IV203_009571 [Nitzschia inconspicua]|uniref:Uncharacterized protein n=1 Tax=Nitzschia inconspicua TaxID=303405 RepID=A0A9K3KVE4_9STRA|nr:hypothetical protein IV203_009571 [Nitzschia inconspicua]